MRSKKRLTHRQPQHIIVLDNARLLLGNIMYHHDDLQSWETLKGATTRLNGLKS